MANVGPGELVVVLLIALIIFGPKRLPELGHSLGRGMREFKAALSGEESEVESEGPAPEPSKRPPSSD